MESISVGVNVQHVHCQVVGGQIHRFKNLLEVHGLLSVSTDGDRAVRFQSFLDEPQEVFLVHAGGGVDVSVHFPAVVEVPVRDGLLGCQLSQFIEQNVELELGLKVGETAVAETLERTVSYHGTHVLHVRHEGLQVGHVVGDGILVLQILLRPVDLEDSLDNPGFVAAVLE